jgi:hypothetical protein
MGVWLQGTWNLPAVFLESIKGSHAPAESEADNETLPLIRCVALSGPLADVWENRDTAAACQHAKKAAEEISGLDADQLHPVLVSMAKDFREVSNLFRVSGTDPDRIHQVLARVLEELTSEEDGSAQEVCDEPR